jgi:hypothetical protein
MSSEEYEIVEWGPENSKGKIESDLIQDLHLKNMIIKHPSVKKRSMTESPIHMCLKVIIVDQLFPQINKILSRGEKLPLKERIKLSIIKDSEELNKKKIIESLFVSGLSLKNTKNRDGKPINIFAGVEYIFKTTTKKYIFKTTTKKILDPNLEVEENILNHIIIRGLKSKKSLDLIPNMVTAIEMLFHPMNREDIDKIIEESEIEITKADLQKIIDKDFQFEVARILKSIRFPSIMDRIRNLHEYVEGSGAGAGAGAAGRSKKGKGPASRSKKGNSNSKKGKSNSKKGKSNSKKGKSKKNRK